MLYLPLTFRDYTIATEVIHFLNRPFSRSLKEKAQSDKQEMTSGRNLEEGLRLSSMSLTSRSLPDTEVSAISCPYCMFCCIQGWTRHLSPLPPILQLIPLYPCCCYLVVNLPIVWVHLLVFIIQCLLYNTRRKELTEVMPEVMHVNKPPHPQHHNCQDPKHSHKKHPDQQVSKEAPQSHVVCEDWRSTGRLPPLRRDDDDLETPILLRREWRSTCSRNGDLETPLLWRSTSRPPPRKEDDGDLETPILLCRKWSITCSRNGDLKTPLLWVHFDSQTVVYKAEDVAVILRTIRLHHWFQLDVRIRFATCLSSLPQCC